MLCWTFIYRETIYRNSNSLSETNSVQISKSTKYSVYVYFPCAHSVSLCSPARCRFWLRRKQTKEGNGFFFGTDPVPEDMNAVLIESSISSGVLVMSFYVQRVCVTSQLFLPWCVRVCSVQFQLYSLNFSNFWTCFFICTFSLWTFSAIWCWEIKKNLIK